MRDDVFYGACICKIWPLSTRAPVGRCGRCGVQPEGHFRSKEDAFNWYYALHGRVPPK